MKGYSLDQSVNDFWNSEITKILMTFDIQYMYLLELFLFIMSLEKPFETSLHYGLFQT